MTTVAALLAEAWQSHQSGNVVVAEQGYRRAIQLDPQDANAWCYLGMAHYDQRRFTDAIDAYSKALGLNPSFPVAYNNLGNAHLATGDVGRAVKSYQAAIRLNPRYSNAYSNLGGALLKAEQVELAVQCCQTALHLAANNVDAYNSLSASLIKQGRLHEAQQASQQGLQLAPQHTELLNSLGAALVRQCKFDEGIAAFRRILELNPQHNHAMHNLAAALMRSGRIHESIPWLRRAIELDSGYAEAHKVLGMALLRLGEFPEGWQQYEWRLECLSDDGMPSGLPRWDGEDLNGKSILLCAEQGLGDTIQFARYGSVLKRQYDVQVALRCQSALQSLLRTLHGVDQVVADQPDLSQFDCCVPLMSLPGMLGTDLDSIPAGSPYLAAQADLVTRWQQPLHALDGFRIGFAWQGNRDNETDYMRSIPLQQFLRLIDVPHTSWISLQKGDGAEALRDLAPNKEIVDLADQLDEAADAFVDTAAVMQHLDLVITCDTSLAHLAGALGVNVWIALSSASDWRWLTQRTDSPWYPTARLYRQVTPGSWAEVFARIREDLVQLTR